jgi:cytochrome c oxidase assembly protein subunit 11
MQEASLPRPAGTAAGVRAAVGGVFFAFGFALVPLYDTFCEAVGFNGKTLKDASPPRIPAQRHQLQPQAGRAVPRHPDARPALGDPPLEPAIELHPGELRTTRFLVRNLSDQTIVGQAVPSVSPTVAARHFRKLDCFCFTQQTLAPGESREMALTFIIDGDIGDEISELTLAYAFFLAPKDPA